MDLQSLIERLQTAESPARSLDTLIAQAVGWTKKTETVKDSKTGEKKKSTLWVVPSGDDVGKVPFYTSNLQHAYELAQTVVPSHVGGCSWEDGSGTAKINGGAFVQAATPQIALCIAALLRLKEDAEKRNPT
jgi:hypothetical protein